MVQDVISPYTPRAPENEDKSTRQFYNVQGQFILKALRA